MNPRFRPQRQHRFTVRVENFGFFFDFAIWFSVAILGFFLEWKSELR